MNDETKTIATITRHITLLRANMHTVTSALERRAILHDESKFRLDELGGFVRINAAAREHPYGSPEYKASLASENSPGGCIHTHYERNSHHPEHHANIEDMGLLDLIEMVCDWKAAADGYGNTPFWEGVNRQLHQRGFLEWQRNVIEEVAAIIEPKG